MISHLEEVSALFENQTVTLWLHQGRENLPILAENTDAGIGGAQVDTYSGGHLCYGLLRQRGELRSERYWDSESQTILTIVILGREE